MKDHIKCEWDRHVDHTALTIFANVLKEKANTERLHREDALEAKAASEALMHDARADTLDLVAQALLEALGAD